MDVEIGAGLPELIARQLGVRQNRQAFDAAMRLSSGIIPVVVLNDAGLDPESTITTQFFSTVMYPGSSGGNFSHTELRNPVGSNRTLYLDRVDVLTVAATIVALRDNALASQLGLQLSPPNKLNKQVGGGGAVAELRYEQKAANLTGNQRWEKRTDAQGNVSFDLSSCGPIRIDPGQALGTEIGLLAPAPASITYQWREVANA